MRRILLLLAAGVTLVVPSIASADVYLSVPTRFLGGPIAPAVPVATPQADPSAPAGAPLSAVAPPPTQADVVGYPCDADDPSDCMTWTQPVDFTPPADTLDPSDPALPATPTPALPAAAADAATVAGGLIAPAPEAWLPWQTPLLRWTATPGATTYNVQVFRGSRLVLSAWPRGNRLRVPAGVLKQGRTYVWVVWSGTGTGAARTYAATPIGRATFEVTLRPRLVFRPGPRRGTTVAEVRPHIPLGRLRVTNALSPRVAGAPPAVTLTPTGRVLLPISLRVAERLEVVLSDRGPAPPLGLRAP